MQTLGELAKVAEWHGFEAADYSATGNTARANRHTAAAATIRAAAFAIEAFLERYESGDPADTAYVAELMRAALKKGPAHD